MIGAFQSEDNYRAVEHRYRRLAHVADAVGVFADFARAAHRATRTSRPRSRSATARRSGTSGR